MLCPSLQAALLSFLAELQPLLSPPIPQVHGAPSSHRLYMCSSFCQNSFTLSLATSYLHLKSLLILHSSYMSPPPGSLPEPPACGYISPLGVLVVPRASPSDLGRQPAIILLITLGMSVKVCPLSWKVSPQRAGPILFTAVSTDPS